MFAGMMANENLFPDASPDEIQDLNTGFLGRHLFETLPLDQLTYRRVGSDWVVSGLVDHYGTFVLTKDHYEALKRFGYSHDAGHWGLYLEYHDRWFREVHALAEDLGVPLSRIEIGDHLWITVEHRLAKKELINWTRKTLHSTHEASARTARANADELTPILRGWLKLVEVVKASPPIDRRLHDFYLELYREWKVTWEESGEKNARVHNAVRKSRRRKP